MPEPANILVKLPSRGRADTLREALASWRDFMSDKHAHHQFAVIADEDDAATLALREELFHEERVRVVAVPPVGSTAAFNAELPDGFDVVVALHDDARPTIRGWDNELRNAFLRHWPAYDGVIALDDHVPCAIPAVGRAYAARGERRHEMYCPGYEGRLRYADFEARAQTLGRLRRVEPPLALHRPSASLNSADDRKLYVSRHGQGFGAQIWDVLICTIDGREAQCARLVAKLEGQIAAAGLVGRVGVIVEKDDCSMSTGKKRNVLVGRSSAEYICFVDDDDDVSDDYVAAVWEGVQSCEVDCVGIEGMIEHPVRSGNWQPFYHSTQYKRYDSTPRGYTRPPNHLNPVRRSIAREFPFRDAYGGEDTDYAVRMLAARVLKSEYYVGHPIYFYTPGGAWAGKKVVEGDTDAG